MILTDLRPSFEEEGGAQPHIPGEGLPPFTILLLLVLSVMSGVRVLQIRKEG